MFHALRHSHASALIAAGIDIVTVSRRLGHGSPAITLGSMRTCSIGLMKRPRRRSKRLLGHSWVHRSPCVPPAEQLSRCRRLQGEVPERSNGAVSKTVVPLAGDRGFESLPLRQFDNIRPDINTIDHAQSTLPTILYRSATERVLS